MSQPSKSMTTGHNIVAMADIYHPNRLCQLSATIPNFTRELPPQEVASHIWYKCSHCYLDGDQLNVSWRHFQFDSSRTWRQQRPSCKVFLEFHLLIATQSESLRLHLGCHWIEYSTWSHLVVFSEECIGEDVACWEVSRRPSLPQRVACCSNYWPHPSVWGWASPSPLLLHRHTRRWTCQLLLCWFSNQLCRERAKRNPKPAPVMRWCNQNIVTLQIRPAGSAKSSFFSCLSFFFCSSIIIKSKCWESRHQDWKYSENVFNHIQSNPDSCGRGGGDLWKWRPSKEAHSQRRLLGIHEEGNVIEYIHPPWLSRWRGWWCHSRVSAALSCCMESNAESCNHGWWWEVSSNYNDYHWCVRWKSFAASGVLLITGIVIFITGAVFFWWATEAHMNTHICAVCFICPAFSWNSYALNSQRNIVIIPVNIQGEHWNWEALARQGPAHRGGDLVASGFLLELHLPGRVDALAGLQVQPGALSAPGRHLRLD